MSISASSITCSKVAPSGASITRLSTVTLTVFWGLLKFASASVNLQARPRMTGTFVLHPMLDLHQPVKHCLGPRRTSRDIQMYRDDPIDSLQHRVVVVRAARTGARPERDHPLRLRHLLIDAAQNRGPPLRDRPHYEEQVGLARRKTRQRGAESIDIVTRSGDRKVFHSTARGD